MNIHTMSFENMHFYKVNFFKILVNRQIITVFDKLPNTKYSIQLFSFLVCNHILSM